MTLQMVLVLRHEHPIMYHLLCYPMCPVSGAIGNLTNHKSDNGPDEVRTRDRSIKSRALYQAELRARQSPLLLSYRVLDPRLVSSARSIVFGQYALAGTFKTAPFLCIKGKPQFFEPGSKPRQGFMIGRTTLPGL